MFTKELMNTQNYEEIAQLQNRQKCHATVRETNRALKANFILKKVLKVILSDGQASSQNRAAVCVDTMSSQENSKGC